MKKKILKISVFFLFFLIKQSYSYTVQELVELAEKNNPQLIKIQKELKVLKRKVKVAKKLFNPSISISLDGEELFKSPLESGRIYIRQYLPYPEKFQIQKEIEKRKYQSEYYLLISKKENIFSEIYKNAYRIWLIQKNIDIYRKYLKKLHNILLVNVPEEEKLRIQSTILELRIKIKNLKYNYKIQLAKLSQLVNTEVNYVNVKIEKPAEEPDLEEITKKLPKSPFYKSVEKDIEKAKEVYKLAKMIYYPDFTISARIDTGGSLTEALSLGIGIKLPIWRTVKQEQNVLSKQLEIVAAKEKLRYILNDLKYKLQESYYNIKFINESFPLINTQIQHLKKEFSIRKKKESNYIILLEPLIDQLKKEIQKNEYIYQSHIEQIKIKAILGEL